MNKKLKKELKLAKKENKKCKKLYSDWEDNEFNCGPLKFIWGVVSHDDLHSSTPSFYSMNDIDICYNRDTHKFLLGIETIYQFNSFEDKSNYLKFLLTSFESYLKENHIFNINYDPHLLYIYNNGEMFIGDNLTELYYKFKIFVGGYVQL